MTNDLHEAEKVWRALGALEVVLQDSIKELDIRLQQMRKEGRHEDAEAIASQRYEVIVELRRVSREAHEQEVAYFKLKRKYERVR